jgi:hypothetical protein
MPKEARKIARLVKTREHSAFGRRAPSDREETHVREELMAPHGKTGIGSK